MATLNDILQGNDTVIRQQTQPNSISPDEVADRLDAVAQFANDNTAEQIASVATGVGEAKFSTNPSLSTLSRYNAADRWGTYTYFLDSLGTPITLLEADFENMQSVQFYTTDEGVSWDIAKIELPGANLFVKNSDFTPYKKEVDLMWPAVFETDELEYQKYEGTSLTQWGASVYARAGVGVLLIPGGKINNLKMGIRVPLDNVYLRAFIYTRLATDSASTTAPGLLPGDVLKQTVELKAGTDYTPNSDPLVDVPIKFEFTEIPYNSSSPIVLAFIKSHLADGVTRSTLGIQRVDSATAISDGYVRGWTTSPSTTTETSGTIVATTTVTLARIFGYTEYKDKVAKANNAIFTNITPNFQEYILGVNNYTATQFARIAHGFRLKESEVLKTITSDLLVPATCNKLQFWIYTRLATDSASTTAPGLLPGDVLVGKYDKVAGVDFTAPNDNLTITVTLPGGGIPYNVTSPIILTFIKSYKVDSSRSTLAGKYGSTPLIADPYVRGWNTGSSTSNDTSAAFNSSPVNTWNRVYAGTAIQNNISKAQADILTLSNSIPNPPSYWDRINLSNLHLTGLSLEVTGQIKSLGTIDNFTGTLAITASTTGSTTVSNYALIYSPLVQWANMPGEYLGYRGINSVTVTKSSDSTLLVNNVDYFIEPNGKIGGILNVANYDVNVSFSYAAIRYDIVQVNRTTLAITIKQGQSRYLDTIEYKPLPDSNCLELATLRIQGTTIQIIETYPYKDMIKLDSEQDFNYLVNYNRGCLPKFLGKVSRGLSLTIAAYGDSISAIQLSGSLPYTANGTTRDRPSYYLKNYPADTVAALPLYDFGDGAGTVHTKLQFNWGLVEKLKVITGTSVTYLNFGIGSTTSQNTTDNGLFPARISPVTDSAADVVIIEFGMNELGQSYTLANIKNMIGQFKAQSKECIVIGVPFVNTERTNNSAWLLTNRYLYQAALETNSAFIPLHWITLNNLGALGISQDDFCGTNVYNHPGILEHKRYGDLLIKCLGI